MPTAPLALLRRTTCPHCWTSFAPEEVLWVSAHADLLGDPRLGPEQPQRFLPTRFNLEGNALDARGFVCQQLACPRCHLPVPRALLEMEPAFLSILGTPACGKSFYLATLTWELRRLLPQAFALAFADADPVANRLLNDNEDALFLNPHADQPAYLANLIRKTELQGELYDMVSYGNQTVSYPKPFLFTLQPGPGHPRRAVAGQIARLLCLYDNAGEHFQPGRETTGSPVTQHLAQAQLLLFLFDPTQDPRFLRRRQEKTGANDAVPARTSRQESILSEAAVRVRRARGLSENARHDRPLIVVLTKCDAWAGLLEDGDLSPPWRAKDGLAGLDRERIERRSQQLRRLMLELCPELVAAAENFAQEVVYVPVSALGRQPEKGPHGLALRPRDIRPVWVSVPLLYGLCRWMHGLIPAMRRRPPGPGRRDSKADLPAWPPAGQAGTPAPPGPGGAKP
jgi:hypothetical protein